MRALQGAGGCWWPPSQSWRPLTFLRPLVMIQAGPPCRIWRSREWTMQPTGRRSEDGRCPGCLLFMRQVRNRRGPNHPGTRPPEAILPEVITQGVELYGLCPRTSRATTSTKRTRSIFTTLCIRWWPTPTRQRPTLSWMIWSAGAKKPQTPVLLRSLLQSPRTTTSGGIVLPPGMVRLNVDEGRVQQVRNQIAVACSIGTTIGSCPMKTARTSGYASAKRASPSSTG